MYKGHGWIQPLSYLAGWCAVMTLRLDLSVYAFDLRFTSLPTFFTLILPLIWLPPIAGGKKKTKLETCCWAGRKLVRLTSSRRCIYEQKVSFYYFFFDYFHRGDFVMCYCGAKVAYNNKFLSLILLWCISWYILFLGICIDNRAGFCPDLKIQKKKDSTKFICFLSASIYCAV